MDAACFRGVVAEARAARRAGDAEGAAELYRNGLGLWRGIALEDIGLPSIEPARSELDALRLAALEERIDLELELGRAQELAGELEDLVARHPLCERLRAQLMIALYATASRPTPSTRTARLAASSTSSAWLQARCCATSSRQSCGRT